MAEAVWTSGPSPEAHAVWASGPSGTELAESGAEIRSVLALPFDMLMFPAALTEPEVEAEIGL